MNGESWGINGGKIGEELGSGFWNQILWKITRLLGVQQQKQQASRIGTWHSACITAAMITWGGLTCAEPLDDDLRMLLSVLAASPWL